MAFALATHTPILLMDEPTNGLDILGRSQFKSILARPEHANRIVIISTHQAHDLESLMTHVLFVDEGQVALSSNMENLQTRLSMGIVDDVTRISNVIYHESLGAQTSYIAASADGVPRPIQLELLYKALSLNKTDILACLNQQDEHQGGKK